MKHTLDGPISHPSDTRSIPLGSSSRVISLDIVVGSGAMSRVSVHHLAELSACHVLTKRTQRMGKR